MKILFRGRTILVAASLAFHLVGCASPKVVATMLRPAKSDEVTRLKRIAVLPLSGRDGEKLRDDIEATLVGIRLHDAPYFTIIDRSSLQQVLKEHSLQLSGLIDEKTAVTVGRLVGAEGVVLGSVTTNNVEDTSYYEKRSKGSVGCTKRLAVFAFTPKVVSVTTGQVLVAESVAGQVEESACRDGQTPLTGRTELLAAARKKALVEFRNMVAPHGENVAIVILEKDDSKPPKEAEKKLAAGIEWARQNRLDRACELWREAYLFHPHGYAIHYNLGLCAELTGNLTEARELYEKADRLTPLPVGEINEALTRTRMSRDQKRKLEEQLRKGTAPQTGDTATPTSPTRMQPSNRGKI